MADFHVHIPYEKIDSHLSFIREQRFNLEIYFSSKTLDSISRQDLASLREKLDYNPLLTIHAPFMDLSPGAIDSKVRAVTIERFSHVLNIAEALKVKAVVFHSGYEKWKYSLRPDLWLDASLETWRPLVKRADDGGVKIAIENIFEDEPANLKLLMQEMSSKNLGICFDTGHLNLFSKVKLEDWMEALNPYIIELHLHDNNRTSDQHLPIGEGTFDFDKFFSLLENKNCIYTLEAHNAEDVRKSIERLRKYL
ncbi:MAG: sugar phosphate isomerase/epimerase [Nitrospirae bacterium]|nr:MAG: sugar phosphate isomerase/epimerase [Nitrospirota bacterium]